MIEKLANVGDPEAVRAAVETVADELRVAIQAVVLSLTGPSPRPGDLIASTGLDKSLAGRIVRGIRSEHPLEAIHELPGPQGLRKLTDAARSGGAPSEEVTSAEKAVDRYSTLIAGFADGRSGLQTAIGGWLPGAMASGLRTARQVVFRSMGYVLGFQAKATLHTSILVPSKNAVGSRDGVAVVGHFGLRRLRPGSPIMISGQSTTNRGVVTIDGQEVTAGGAQLLLREYCTDPIPELELLRSKSAGHLVLPSGSPALNQEIQLVSGVVTREMWGEKEDGSDHQSLIIAPRIPSRVFCCELYLRDDYPFTDPRVWISLSGAGVSGELYVKHWQQHLEELDLTYDVVKRRSGVPFSNAEIPGYPRMVSDVFSRLGEDPSLYRLLRVRWEYPLPSAQVVWWLDHPGD